MTGEKNSAGSVCAAWWRGALAGDTGAARRARAELRRADGPVAALAVPETHALHRALKAAGHEPAPERLALIAAALAQIDIGGGAQHPACAFGAGDPPALSPIRFNILIRAHDIHDLWRPLIRALRQVGSSVGAGPLGNDIHYWGDKVRTRWCFDYYGEPFAAPTEKEPAE